MIKEKVIILKTSGSVRILEIKSLDSIEQLKKLVGDYKRQNKSAITNYIPDSALHTKWVTSGLASIYIFDGGYLVCFDNGTMLECLFMTVSEDKLKGWMREISIKTGRPVVVEHVVREGRDRTISDPAFKLRRMSRIGEFENLRKSSDRIEKAIEKDIQPIQDIFRDHFNPLTERIPDEAELRRLIHDKGISIVRNDGEIIGMVIYEKKQSSIHLRYWWVAPKQRGKGVGSELLHDYFCAGSECKRQFLWVFSDNSNAIDKYRHYGFEFDGVSDNIYIENI